MIEIANEGMAGTIRRVAVERGVDPRDFELVAFGGAGPLHAAEIAASLGMAGVIVPPHPGLASAFGTLLADRRVDRRWTHYSRSDAVDVDALAARLDAMEQRRARGARRGGLRRRAGGRADAEPALRRAELRAGRAAPAGRGSTRRALGAAFDAFHALHHDVYGYSFPGETIELIHANVSALGPGAQPGAGIAAGGRPAAAARGSRGAASPAGSRSATPVFRREDLPADGTAARSGDRRGARLDHARPPGQELRVLADGTLRLSRDDGAPVPGARSTASR